MSSDTRRDGSCGTCRPLARFAREPRAPSMGAVMRVKVLPKGDHSERSGAQLRKGDRPWEGSAEQNLRVDAQEPDERRRGTGRACEVARSSNGQRVQRRRSGDRAGKDSVLTWGDLALCSKERRWEGGARSQQKP